MYKSMHLSFIKGTSNPKHIKAQTNFSAPKTTES